MSSRFAAGANAKIRARTASLTRSSKRRKIWSGMSTRRPSFSRSVSSVSDLSTISEYAFSDNSAPAFSASAVMTCASPRSTRTSVKDALRLLRREIASRCDWLLAMAISTRSCVVRRSDSARTGPATAISSSTASV